MAFNSVSKILSCNLLTKQSLFLFFTMSTANTMIRRVNKEKTTCEINIFFRILTKNLTARLFAAEWAEARRHGEDLHIPCIQRSVLEICILS